MDMRERTATPRAGPYEQRMDIVQQPGARRGVSSCVSAHASVLAAVRRDGVNVAVWRRPVPRWVEQALARWARTAPAERTNVWIDFGTDARAACAELVEPVPGKALRDWLQRDVLALGAELASLSGEPVLQAQLGAARTDRCKKLHVDYVRLRLITTYAGPGTEWLPDAAVERSILSDPPECHLAANARIARDARRIRHARAGDVLVLKGELDAPGRGAVHRSPPIEASGGSRVVLSLTARGLPRG